MTNFEILLLIIVKHVTTKLPLFSDTVLQCHNRRFFGYWFDVCSSVLKKGEKVSTYHFIT